MIFNVLVIKLDFPLLNIKETEEPVVATAVFFYNICLCGPPIITKEQIVVIMGIPTGSMFLHLSRLVY